MLGTQWVLVPKPIVLLLLPTPAAFALTLLVDGRVDRLIVLSAERRRMSGERLLCYESKPPHLRVLDLFSRDIELLPTPWDKGYAIDTAWHRDTYIALNQTDRGIIRFERSLAGPGRLLGPSHYSPFPASDRDHMWLCNPEGRKHGEPHVAQEVDGYGRVVRELNLPGGAFLRGELDKGFFVEIGSGHFMWSGRGPIKERLLTGGWFVGIVQNMLIWVAVDSPGTLRWVGAHEGSVTPPVVDKWSHIWLSPAPFGSKVAITFDSTAKGRGGLAIVDLATASCTIASGDFKYSSYKPVWSLDGASIFLGLPFERHIARAEVDSPELKLLAIKKAPMPILAL
jgi:hypothetical protein